MKRFLLLLAFLFGAMATFAQTGEYRAGDGALVNRTYGTYNTAVGNSCLYNLTTGKYNTSLGYRAGYSLITAYENVFIGYEAAYQCSTRTDNTIIGFRAGYFTNSDDNTMIGNGAGFNNTDGQDNTFIGHAAGADVTTGDDNTYVGNHAGSGKTFSISYDETATTTPSTGSDNTFVGSAAGYSITSGYRNAFFGSETGWDCTTGYRNTFIGDSAGIDLSNGHNNTFIGQAAGACTEFASYNTFVGNRAGWENNRTADHNNANYNTCVGYQAGYNNRTGQRNVVFGALADFSSSATTSGNNDNVIIGYEAELIGADSFDAGYNRSIIVGSYAKANNNDAITIGYKSMVTGNNSLAIGREDTVSGSNSISLGYLSSVYGDNSFAFGDSVKVGDYNYAGAIGAGSSVIGNNRLALGGNTTATRVSVGIGTNAPDSLSSLHLADTDKGLILNSLTNAQRTTLEGQIAAQHEGMFVYDNQDNALYAWDGAAWFSINTDKQDLTISGNTLSLTNDATDVDLSSFLDNTDEQELSLASDILSISGGINTIDLSPYLDDTDTHLTEAEVDAMVDNNGYLTSFTELDGDNTNEIQDLQLIGNNLTITNNGTATTIDLTPYLDNTDTQLTEAEVDAMVDNNGYLTSFTEVDGDATNEIQDIALVGTDLSITSGSTIDLSGIDTNTQLTESEVDAMVDNNGYLTSFTELDGDATNEIQDISLVGTDLSISDGSTIDLSVIDTNTQLTESEVDAMVDNNGYLTSFTEVDGDATNEIQDISLDGTDLSISSGSTVDLSAIQDGTGTDEQTLGLNGTELTISNGNTIDLSPIVEPLQIEIDDLNDRVDYLELVVEDCCGGAKVEESIEQGDKAILYQNIPNPWNETTTIKYYIPQNAHNAKLEIRTSDGKLINIFEITANGEGQIMISSQAFSEGTYLYTLYVDNRMVETKRFVLTN